MPGSKTAPKKFKGKYSEVKSFIQYCSRHVQQFIKSLPLYSAERWDQFKADILKYFDANRANKKYKIHHLEAFVLEARKKSTVKSLGAWREYVHSFITISGWLKTKKKITLDKEALFFWKGIPCMFQTILKGRLLISDPAHNMSKPFSMSSISQAAKSILQCNCFDSDRLQSDDNEEEPACKKVSKSKKKKVVAKKKVIIKKEETDDSDDKAEAKKAQAAPRKAATGDRKKANKVEELIHKMNKMSLSDPEYGVLYFRACSLSSLAAAAVRPPMLSTAVPTATHVPAYVPPIAQPASIPTQQIPAAMGPHPPMKCYGCGATGHEFAMCPEINNLLSNGTVMRNASGRLIMKDHQAPATTHFITTKPKLAYITHATIKESDDLEDEGIRVQAVEESEGNVLVDQATKSTREARDKTGKNVFKPPAAVQEKVGKKKEKETQHNAPPHLSQPVDSTASGRLCGTNQGATPGPSQPSIPAYGKPITVNPQRFDAEDDDEIMEDDEPVPPAADKGEGKPKPRTGPKPEPTKRVPKQSMVQAQVEPWNVLAKVLSAPVTLQVGEIFGISKEMTQHLQEALKPKPPKNVVATAFQARSKGTLILLRMVIDNQPITAIINTGSQLNIASR
ncbi:hypothetical protein EVJ58_g9992 [Rhodofomes roseus]|uniref:CCHC-type domain-containing protein n=1 Tax=Rhodofomes roseus TaxID=34475 RepID=A0A4Y9XSV6_9APHY|nr:hypothetical protein EVJ58_g9992 [Rhodofomes roseus]